MRRTFTFLADEEPYERDEVRQLLMDLEGSLHQLGGAVTISALREQIGPDMYVTTGMIVSFDSFTPPIRREPQTETEDEDGRVPEPVGD